MIDETKKTDLNKDDKSKSNDSGQSDKKTQKGEDKSSVTLTKEEHDKLVRERDGYKAQAIKKQSKKPIEKSKPAKSGAGDTVPTEEVKNLVQEGIDQYSSSTRKALQTRAQEAFLREHPELVESGGSHDEVIAHLNLRGDEITIGDYQKRFRSAFLLWKDERGELDDYLAKEKDRATRQARIAAEVDAGRDTGRSGDERDKGKGSPTLSPKGEEIARGMKVDPAKAAKVVYGSADNVIDVMAPKNKE